MHRRCAPSQCTADRSGRRQRAVPANGWISFSVAARRMLSLPASAVASISAPSGVAAAGEADADLVTAEQRMLALCRGVFLIDELALPAAVRRGVGAEIIEEGVAAENAAVMQQHHAGMAAGNAVQHPDVDRVEPADDAAVADRTGRRNVVVAERRHDRAKHRAGVLHHVALEAIEFALRPAAHADGDFVGTDQRSALRRRAVAPGPEPGNDFAVHILVAAEMGECRIAAEHLAVMGVQHAAAGAVIDVVFDLVQPFHRAPRFCPAANLAGLAPVTSI